MSHEPVRAPRGTQRSCKGWAQEAALRMLQNNLDPEVAERPDDLVVYGGTGKAARNWEALRRHRARAPRPRGRRDPARAVRQGGRASSAPTNGRPRVLIANSNLVPHWATWDEFRRLEQLGLTMYGQMTAGSWIYIGTQGILQGTYETFVAAARASTTAARSDGTLWVLTAGLGGMGGAQPLAGDDGGGVSCLAVEVDPSRIEQAHRDRYVDERIDDLDDALRRVDAAPGRQQSPRLDRPLRQRRRGLSRAARAAASCRTS